nr:PREDICTED: probable 39S ribosomal protein L17, mitochondrial [Musa acuminata subsp. malaccensis]
MLRTMVSQLVKHERIETTVAKAKQVRRIADNMVQLGKDTLHAACVLLLLFVVMMFFINCSQSLLIATSKCLIYSPCFACSVARFGENFVINIRD